MPRARGEIKPRGCALPLSIGRARRYLGRMLFWVEFHPCRPDFFQSMSQEEALVMMGHLRSLEQHQEAGRLEFAGRTAGAEHGLAIFELPSEEELAAVLAENPAVKAGLLVPRARPYTLPIKP